MKFHEVLESTITLLKSRGRVSYRSLKREFDIGDEFIEDIKDELTHTLRVAHDDGGTMLVWNDASAITPASAPAATEEPAAKPQAKAAAAERRQLTVMFCDVVNSTALSGRLDPEELHAIIGAYQQVAAEVTERMGGYIAQYLGDGVLVYFGYPSAHEDDARRAVASALEIIANLEPLRATVLSLHGEPFAIRIGIHTGAVVVAELGRPGRHEQLALGDTPNIAARVESLAMPDSVMVTAPTWRLIDGYFIGESHGEQILKGVAQPMPVWQVIGDSGAQSRLDAAHEGMTPLIGRDRETRFLLERWAESCAGHGQVVMLGGEAGIGKSRLVAMLQDHVRINGAAEIVFRCSPYHANSAFHPVIQQFRKYIELNRDDSLETQRAKLARAVPAFSNNVDQVTPLLAWLLSIPLDAPSSTTTPLGPQQQRQQAQEALLDWIDTLSKTRPLLMMFEDLHWADPTTLEFLTMLIERVTRAPILMVLTFRLEFNAPWINRPGVSQLTLDRLSEAQSEAMIDQLAHASGLPPDVIQQVVEKTDGVPLFIEELLKMILESGMLRAESGRYPLAGPLAKMDIPATLQESLMARLDRLSMAREVAQIGAVIGREFTLEMIQSVASLDMETLSRGLAQLVQGEIIFRRGGLARPGYVFKHALIRDAAYQSILKSQRLNLHKRIAQAIIATAPAIAANEPELLAHHYAEGGLPEHAIAHWHRAAQRAIERSANREGIAYLRHALDMLEQLPAGPARSQSELELCVTLGVPLIATRGYADVEVERTYARARELALEAVETPQLPNIVWGLWVFYLCGGPLDAALATAVQYRDLALAHPDDSGQQLEACQLMGISHFYRGEFEAALPYLEAGSELYDREAHHALIFAHGGADTGAAIRSHLALTLWALGHEARAREEMEAAMSTARDVAHPFSHAFAFYFHGWFHKLCRDESSAQYAAGEALALCDMHGFPFWGLTSAVLKASTQPEQAGAAKSEMQARLDAFVAIGGLLHLGPMRALLAHACASCGDVVPAREQVAQAIRSLEGRDERWYEAELHRLAGELLLREPEPDTAAAEASLRRALQVARAQRADGWVLRATCSLARALTAQGRNDEAAALLREARDAMSTRLDSADGRESSELLHACESLTTSE